MKANLFRFVIARPPLKISDEKLADHSVATHPPEIGKTELLEDLIRFRNADIPDRAGMQKRSRAYLVADSAEYIHTLDKLGTPIISLDHWIVANQPTLNTEAFLNFIKSILNTTITDFVHSSAYLLDRRRVADSLLAHYLAGDQNLQVPAHLPRALRIFGILERLSRDEQGLLVPGELKQALKAIIRLPSQLYPLPRPDDKRSALRDKIHQEQQEAYKATIERANELAGKIFRHKKAITEILAGYDIDLMRDQVKENEDNEIDGDRDDSNRSISILPRSDQKPTLSILSAEASKLLSDETKALLESFRVPLDQIGVVETVRHLERRLADLANELHQGELDRGFVIIGGNLNLVADYAGPNQYLDPSSDNTGCPLPDDCVQVEPESPAVDGELPIGPGDFGSPKPSYGELMIVEQTLQRYELGEIAHIENVLIGEKKVRTHRRTQTSEEIFFTETERVEETERDLQSTERFELQSETEKVISEDKSIGAGLTVTGKYGPTVEFSANASYARDTSREESHRTATNFSRDVTERAVSRLQERVLEQRTRRIVIEVEETNKHVLDNIEGDEHIAGVYRWVDKVYKAQVVNYGQRVLIELVIPEPAAFLRFALAKRTTAEVDLVKPSPPGYCRTGTSTFVPLQPQEICEENYMFWMAKYQVPGIEPPPAALKIVGKAYDNSNVHKGFDTHVDAEIRVPEGYLAQRAWIVDGAARIGDTNAIDAYIGRRFLTDSPVHHTKVLNGEDGDLPVSLFIYNVQAFVANIEIECRRAPETYTAWQIATYNAIMLAYNEQLADYEDRISAIEIRQGVAIGGNNPLRNQQYIRDELKRNAISIFTDQHFDDFNALRKGVDEYHYPQLYLPRVSQEGPYIRFFEQAFEWEHMAYVFYPYYWGRKDDWTKNMLLNDDDPLFAEFLRAGAARVVIPVRPDFEVALASYITHGWPIPNPTDSGLPDEVDGSEPPILSLISEVQGQQGYDGSPGVGTISVVENNPEVTGDGTNFIEVKDTDREIHILGVKYRISAVASTTEITLDRPYEGASRQELRYSVGPQYIGEPWEVRVPTSLVFLENGTSSLPTFD